MALRPPPPRKLAASGDWRPTPGLIVAGKYRLEQELSSGGMGTIWSATHLGLDTTVACKFLTLDADDDTLGRFTREAKAAAAVRSSNIVQILDHGYDRGLPYIVMEFLRGEDLEARLRREGRMSLEALCPIVSQLARGLAMAHGAGLVHRDLKPNNIYLAKEGEDEVVKILDFGVVKASQGVAMEVSSKTRAGMLLGTPIYMSPEQARARADVDHRTDIWSLGVVVYRALTGRKPFEGRVIGDVIAQICADPIPVATTIAPDLPGSVDVFFARALSRDRDARFQSAKELSRALHEVAGLGRASSLPASSAAASGQFAAIEPAPVSVTGVTAPLAGARQSSPSLTVGSLTSSVTQMAPRSAGAARAGARVAVLAGGAGLLVAAIAWLVVQTVTGPAPSAEQASSARSADPSAPALSAKAASANTSAATAASFDWRGAPTPLPPAGDASAEPGLAPAASAAASSSARAALTPASSARTLVAPIASSVRPPKPRRRDLGYER